MGVDGKWTGEEPLVSVIMNCYNGEKYLREAIDSVITQTYQNWELIFWDNQSTDRSAEIFKSYEDERLKYCYAPKHSEKLYEARGYAFSCTSGELIAFLDVDDWWFPHKLEEQVGCFADANVGIVCGNYWIYNVRKGEKWLAHKRSVAQGFVTGDLLKHYFVGLLTLIVRRSAMESLEYPFNGKYHIIGDFDLVVRLSAAWRLACVSNPVACYRVHGENISSVSRDLQEAEIADWLSNMYERHEEIVNNRGFDLVVNYRHYLGCINAIMRGDKARAFIEFYQLSWGVYKLRAMVGLVMPIRMINFFLKS